jgi:hypothetical protein
VDWRKLLLRRFLSAILLGSLFSLALPMIAVADMLDCSPVQARTRTCSGAQVTNNSVDVWANQTSGGGSVEGATWGGVEEVPGAGSSAGGAAPWSFYPRIPDSPQQARGYCLVLVKRAASCFSVAPPATAPIVEAAYARPMITIADVTSFSPQQPTLTTEPLGWAIVGLESNMITSTTTHVIAGVLLGAPAQVRFTPVSFDFDYGDGGIRHSSSSGAPWVAQGLAEFSPTPTSHIFQQTGSYRVTVRVGFAIEYRWDVEAWTPLDGRVQATAPAQVVLVVNAANVLVQEACRQGRDALGC